VHGGHVLIMRKFLTPRAAEMITSTTPFNLNCNFVLLTMKRCTVNLNDRSPTSSRDAKDSNGIRNVTPLYVYGSWRKFGVILTMGVLSKQTINIYNLYDINQNPMVLLHATCRRISEYTCSAGRSVILL